MLSDDCWFNKVSEEIRARVTYICDSQISATISYILEDEIYHKTTIWSMFHTTIKSEIEERENNGIDRDRRAR